MGKVILAYTTMGILVVLITFVILYRVGIAKKKFKPVKIDKEKTVQELSVLRNTVAYLERQRILGNITEEKYQKEMAVVDFKVKELEKELLDD